MAHNAARAGHWWKELSAKRKGRKHHAWRPGMWVAADEYECWRCQMRAQIVPYRATVSVRVKGVMLQKQITQKVYLLKEPGTRKWTPVLELPQCAGGAVRG